jgi:hypothetical protein
VPTLTWGFLRSNLALAMVMLPVLAIRCPLPAAARFGYPHADSG